MTLTNSHGEINFGLHFYLYFREKATHININQTQKDQKEAVSLIPKNGGIPGMICKKI